jgi:hypothetical protein
MPAKAVRELLSHNNHDPTHKRVILTNLSLPCSYPLCSFSALLVSSHEKQNTQRKDYSHMEQEGMQA